MVIFLNKIGNQINNNLSNLYNLYEKFNIPLGFLITYDEIENFDFSNDELKEDLYDSYLTLDIDTSGFNINKILSEKEPFVVIKILDKNGNNVKTIFNIKGKESFLNIINEIKHSQFSSTDFFVFCQKMIFSEISGKSFYDNENIIVQALYGIGKDFSKRNNDIYIVDKDSLSIKSIKVNYKEFAYFFDNESEKIEKINLNEKSNKQVLSEKEIFEIARLVKRISVILNKKVGINFGIYKGEIYIFDVFDLDNNLLGSHDEELIKENSQKSIFSINQIEQKKEEIISEISDNKTFNEKNTEEKNNLYNNLSSENEDNEKSIDTITIKELTDSDEYIEIDKILENSYKKDIQETKQEKQQINEKEIIETDDDFLFSIDESTINQAFIKNNQNSLSENKIFDQNKADENTLEKEIGNENTNEENKKLEELKKMIHINLHNLMNSIYEYEKEKMRQILEKNNVDLLDNIK
ncbi:MAG: PEP/pyruvate-binding domain-containing protein [Candidatus Woesearchaeota archaeon]